MVVFTGVILAFIQQKLKNIGFDSFLDNREFPE